MSTKKTAGKPDEPVYDANFDPDVAIPLYQLCQICGISRTSGERRVKDGTFVSSMNVGRGNKALYPLKENVLKYYAYKEEQLRAELQTDDVDELKAQKLKAEIGLKQSQGELHQLKTAHAQGQYIAKEDVVLDLERFFVQLKKFLQALPSRIGGTVAGYVEPVIERGIERDIQTEVNSMLQAFCDASEPYKHGDGV